ncbi:hypothetical protein [Corynebacterium argentoratense]
MIPHHQQVVEMSEVLLAPRRVSPPRSWSLPRGLL